MHPSGHETRTSLCAVVEGATSAPRRWKPEPFDRRVKWPREHAIFHALKRTYVTWGPVTRSRFTELCFSAYTDSSNRNVRLFYKAWLSTSRLRCSGSWTSSWPRWVHAFVYRSPRAALVVRTYGGYALVAVTVLRSKPLSSLLWLYASIVIVLRHDFYKLLVCNRNAVCKHVNINIM